MTLIENIKNLAVALTPRAKSQPPEETTVSEPAPAILEVDFQKNITDLYKAITESDWDAAITAVKKHPDEAKTWVVRKYDDNPEKNLWRFLPIHSACARQPPAELISALIAAYPEGVRSVDDQGMYALHYAAGNQASRAVMKSLIVTFPDAAKLKDPRGMLPIHYLACWGPSSIAVVDMVMVANRNIADAKDEDGNTPLDLASLGEYQEKNAVVAALRRWSNATNENKIPTLLSTPSHSKAELNSYKFLGSKFRAPSFEEETKTDSFDGVSGISLTISPTIANKLYQPEDQISIINVESKEEKVENSMLELELKERDELIQKLKSELEQMNDECDGLRKTLADVTEQHESLASMNSSLLSMVEQQEVVLLATRAREEQWENLASLRRERLRELVEMEEDDTFHEVDLRNTLARQAHEMAAIKAEMTTTLGAGNDSTTEA